MHIRYRRTDAGLFLLNLLVTETVKTTLEEQHSFTSITFIVKNNRPKFGDLNRLKNRSIYRRVLKL